MSKETVAEAIHAQDGDDHVVTVSHLRVMLSKDDTGWFAQGLEIDYAAAGADMEETKKNFETGFFKTVHEHLELHGSIEKLLIVAPQEAWAEFFKKPKDSVAQSFSCFQFHSIIEGLSLPKNFEFPFDRIAFITRGPELMAETC